MGKINMGRVIVGGLVAGLVLNISEFVLNTIVLGVDMAANVARLGLPAIGGQAIGAFVGLCFLLGIVIVWLYAAIRPRFGFGARTACIAAVVVWFLAYLYGGVGMLVMGIFPARVEMIGLAWGLVEVLIAANAGAYLYKE